MKKNNTFYYIEDIVPVVGGSKDVEGSRILEFHIRVRVPVWSRNNSDYR